MKGNKRNISNLNQNERERKVVTEELLEELPEKVT